VKKVFILVVIVSVAAGAYYYWSHRDDGSAASAQAAGAPAGRPPAEVNVVTIKEQSINFTKDLPGRTSPYKIAEIRPQVNGIITKRLYTEGSVVTEGQQLYQIDPATYEAALNSSRANLMKAEATLKAAQAQFARVKELVKIDAVSKQEFDDANASLDQGKADVAIAKAALVTSQINLDYTKVFSPISGRIGKSFVTEGALVTANQTTALATVQQFDPIYVDVTQSSTELMELRSQLESAEKTPVTLLLDNTTKAYEQKGELQFSDVTVDQTTGSVQLRVLFPNPKLDLLPGLFVHARIEQARDPSAILVPQKSITRNADGSVTVWVVGEGDKVSLRPIKVSQAIGDQWLVTEGLKTGDRVIVEGTQKVSPDAIVKPVEIIAKEPVAASDATPDAPPAEEPKAEAPAAEAAPAETDKTKTD
jgi:membrane fusion protein (multidrug efflux system)